MISYRKLTGASQSEFEATDMAKINRHLAYSRIRQAVINNVKENQSKQNAKPQR